MSNDFVNIDTPTVTAQVDPSTAKLGDLLTLRINVTHPQALTVEPPALAKTLGTFEVQMSTPLAPEVADGKAIDHFQAVLQNFATGQQIRPGIPITYRDPMGAEHALKTPDVTVTIQEVPPGPKDKGDIRGFKGVIGPTAWSPWWWALLAAVLVGAAAYVWVKRKRMLQGPPPPPPVPADTLAMEKLQKLSQSDWLATGKIKEYYSAVSDIVREYLEKGFDTAALERTTGELMRDLRRKSEIPTVQQAELRELLDACDLVKFAKYRPEIDEAVAAHAAAVKFVEQTRAVLRKDDEEFVPLPQNPPPKK